jgi:hypothetical protein
MCSPIVERQREVRGDGVRSRWGVPKMGCDQMIKPDLVDQATWSRISTVILEFRRILECWDLELDLRLCDICDICTFIAEFVTDLVTFGSLVVGFADQIQIGFSFSPQLLGCS